MTVIDTFLNEISAGQGMIAELWEPAAVLDATVRGWRFERQLGLSLLDMATVFAWEKAVGDQAELDWWERAALDGARWL